MADLICRLIDIYVILMIVRILMSWFPINPDGALATLHGFLHLLTEPVMQPLRRVIPPVRLGGAAMDLSPIVVIFGARVVQSMIC